MCSAGDTFGLVTAEAMACGLPVVGAAAGATQELIEDGVDGLLFERDNVRDLASAIECLIDDPTTAVSVGREAAEKAQRCFTVEQHGRNMERLFQDAIEQYRSQRARKARMLWDT
jgi:glycosyltransferase involved in cell wall biosynthesis